MCREEAHVCALWVCRLRGEGAPGERLLPLLSSATLALPRSASRLFVPFFDSCSRASPLGGERARGSGRGARRNAVLVLLSRGRRRSTGPRRWGCRGTRPGPCAEGRRPLRTARVRPWLQDARRLSSLCFHILSDCLSREAPPPRLHGFQTRKTSAPSPRSHQSVPGSQDHWLSLLSAVGVMTAPGQSAGY